jgi:hypothetical protein
MELLLSTSIGCAGCEETRGHKKKAKYLMAVFCFSRIMKLQDEKQQRGHSLGAEGILNSARQSLSRSSRTRVAKACMCWESTPGMFHSIMCGLPLRYRLYIKLHS